MKKQIQTKTDYYIEFDEDELVELGFKPGQKFSVKEKENGIQLTPYVEVEVDLSIWSREILEYVIDKSCREDISCNEVIEEALKEFISKREK